MENEKAINLQLQEAVSKYAQLSNDVESMVDTREAALDSVRKDPVFVSLEEKIKENKDELSEVRIEIDRLSVEIFLETANKKPHEAVQIKEFDNVEELDHTVAVDWCIKNAPNFVTLDNSGLKKYAIGAQEAGAPLPFIKISKAFKVYLSKDLNKFAILE